MVWIMGLRTGLVGRKRTEWSKQSLCSTVPPTDSDKDVFFPTVGRPPKRPAYLDYCEACPVMVQCMDWAIVHNMDGVWGGLTDRERRRLPVELTAKLLQEARDEGWFEREVFESWDPELNSWVVKIPPQLLPTAQNQTDRQKVLADFQFDFEMEAVAPARPDFLFDFELGPQQHQASA